MDDKALIDDLVKMLDSGMAGGVGHVNIDYDEKVEQDKSDYGMYRLLQNPACLQCSDSGAGFG